MSAMPDKNKTVVLIGNRSYSVRSAESEDHMHRVATYVNRVMDDVRNRQTGLNTSMAAVLTALNIADTAIKQQDEILTLKRELEQLKRKQPGR
jgi:cell division protein ZapA